MKLFDIDSPLMQLMTKIANLMFLNLITLVLCIPIVTGGAALTALNYVVLKMVRDEDCYIMKDYFKSFKANFKQATAIWFICILVALVLGGDFYIFSKIDNLPFQQVLEVVVTLVSVVAVFTLMFVFPVLAKFDNPTGRTIKNAIVISILQFPKTIVMLILYGLIIIIGIGSMSLLVRLIPIFMFFGMSAPAYVGALMYSNFFYKLEDQIYEKNYAEYGDEYDENAVDAKEDDERIFHDELDESIQVEDKKFY